MNPTQAPQVQAGFYKSLITNQAADPGNELGGVFLSQFLTNPASGEDFGGGSTRHPTMPSQSQGAASRLQCPECGAGFMTSGGLYKHMKKHSGEQFACPVCDRHFSQKYSIRAHLKKQHGAAQCMDCLQAFPLGEHFTRHVASCQGT